MAKIRFPRVVVSIERHEKLFNEARRREKAGEPNATIQDVAEELFKKGEQT